MPARSKSDDIWFVLACASAGQRWGGWATSADVAAVTLGLGIHETTQQVASRLARMTRLELPPLASRAVPGGREYRVTNFGRTWVQNLLPAVDLVGDYPHPSELAKEGQGV